METVEIESYPTESDVNYLLHQLHTQQSFTCPQIVFMVDPTPSQLHCGIIASFLVQPYRFLGSIMKQAMPTSHTHIVTCELISLNIVVNGHHVYTTFWKSKVQISAQTPAVLAKVTASCCILPNSFFSNRCTIRH
jgi:hypothetical protein